MSHESIQEYIAKIKPRYKKTRKLEKGFLIKEVCTVNRQKLTTQTFSILCYFL
jgi:hypothetical protein